MLKKKENKIILISILLLISIILLILYLRIINPVQIDDLHPEINCSEEYIEKSDILWVIPNLNNKSVSNNKEWCNQILSLNKTIGMHGVFHESLEFYKNRDQEYLQQGIDIFEQCFKVKPTMFKPPQLKISHNNKKLIKKNNLHLKSLFNQITHKVYHCDNRGLFSNKIIDWI